MSGSFQLPDDALQVDGEVEGYDGTGVGAQEGPTSVRPGCKRCGATWKAHEEKETDVHFALTFLEDALYDAFDRAIIVGADGDHFPLSGAFARAAPANRSFSPRHPDDSAPESFIRFCHSGIEITQDRWRGFA